MNDVFSVRGRGDACDVLRFDQQQIGRQDQDRRFRLDCSVGKAQRMGHAPLGFVVDDDTSAKCLRPPAQGRTCYNQRVVGAASANRTRK